jgi:hypothetical protein
MQGQVELTWASEAVVTKRAAKDGISIVVLVKACANPTGTAAIAGGDP